MNNKRKRIAIFHNLPSGGGERMIKSIIDRYKNTNEIDIYIASDKKQEPIEGCKTYITHLHPWNGFIRRNLWIIFMLPKIHKILAAVIDKKKYDKILITHDYFTKSPYLLKYIKTDNIYLCQEPQREFYEPWQIHAPTIKEKIANILRFPIKWIDVNNVSCSKTILCNSKYSKKVIKNVYKKNCQIIYPGVNEKIFKPGVARKEKIILCVGGINPIKDQYFLVSSLRPILDEYKLVLVGNGKDSYINKIMTISRDKKNIQIVKQISDSELRLLYNKAMVTCICAFREPFGLSSIESQACGTPVVSVREGGPKETIIDGKTGYLSRRNESEYLYKVKEAIRVRDALGKNGRKNIIENWTWEKTLSKLDPLFL